MNLNIELLDPVDIAVCGITNQIEIFYALNSPHHDIQVKNEAQSFLISRIENDISQLWELITNFPEQHASALPDYKHGMIEEMDFDIDKSCRILAVLEDCYNDPRGMPFSRTILRAVMSDISKTMDCVLQSIADYCKEDPATKTKEVQL